MQFLTLGLSRAFSGLISPKLWMLAIAANLLLGFALLYPEATGLTKAVYLSLGLVAFVGMIATQWKMTRALGEAVDQIPGSVVSWIGWSLAAYMPALILLIAPMAVWGFDDYAARLDVAPWWLVTTVMMVTTAAIVPVSVHAAGRAINANGPSLTDCFRACAPIYVPLAISFLIASGAFFVASDWLIEIAPADPLSPTGLLLEGASSLLILASFVWSTAIVTMVWRTVDKGPSAHP